MLALPGLLLPEPVSQGLAGGTPCCRTSLWILKKFKKNKGKKKKKFPLLRWDISAARFGAVQGQPRKASADVLRAPAAPASPVPGRALPQRRTRKERPLHAANAEAAIYFPVPGAEAHKTRHSHQKAVLEEPVRQALRRAARSPTSTRSCRSPGTAGAFKAPHSKAAPPQHHTKRTEGREGAKFSTLLLQDHHLLLVCSPPAHTDLCPRTWARAVPFQRQSHHHHPCDAEAVCWNMAASDHKSRAAAEQDLCSCRVGGTHITCGVQRGWFMNPGLLPARLGCCLGVAQAGRRGQPLKGTG